MYTCAPRSEKSFTNQVFSLTTDGQIRREETCAAVSDEVKDQVDMTKCLEIENVDPERLAAGQRSKRKQTWTHDRRSGLIRNAFDKQCLSVQGLSSEANVLLRPCDPADPSQRWRIQSYV